MTHAFEFIAGIFTKSFFSIPSFAGIGQAAITCAAIIVFVIIEWIGREHSFPISQVGTVRKPVMRYAVYYMLVAAILLLGNFNDNQFIYFQF
jgi:hypothetical protein